MQFKFKITEIFSKNTLTKIFTTYSVHKSGWKINILCGQKTLILGRGLQNKGRLRSAQTQPIHVCVFVSVTHTTINIWTFLYRSDSFSSWHNRSAGQKKKTFMLIEFSSLFHLVWFRSYIPDQHHPGDVYCWTKKFLIPFFWRGNISQWLLLPWSRRRKGVKDSYWLTTTRYYSYCFSSRSRGSPLGSLQLRFLVTAALRDI